MFFFCYVKKKNKNFSIATLHQSKHQNNERKHIDLLYIQNKYLNEFEEWDINKNKEITYHYVWITNYSKLMSAQVSNHKRKTYPRSRCAHHLYSKSEFDKHRTDCLQINTCRVILPEEKNSTIEMKREYQ